MLESVRATVWSGVVSVALFSNTSWMDSFEAFCSGTEGAGGGGRCEIGAVKKRSEAPFFAQHLQSSQNKGEEAPKVLTAYRCFLRVVDTTVCLCYVNVGCLCQFLSNTLKKTKTKKKTIAPSTSHCWTKPFRNTDVTHLQTNTHTHTLLAVHCGLSLSPCFSTALPFGRWVRGELPFNRRH